MAGSGFKIKMLVQYQGGTGFQTAGIFKYVEDMKRGPNTVIGLKDNFETTSNHIKKRPLTERGKQRRRWQALKLVQPHSMPAILFF